MATTFKNRQEHRTEPSPGAGILAALEGAALILWNLIATPFIGKKRLRWGTVGTEATDHLPGDAFVTDPRWSYTLAVAVHAPPENVWPWVAQLGQGRGGFYTYQSLENMMGCRIINTTEIDPDLQDPHVGGEIYLHPSIALEIEIVDPPTAFVLFGSPAGDGNGESWGMSTWQFAIRPDGDGGSRLLTRGRYDYGPDRKSRITFGRFPVEVISFVMSRKMMLEIKRLAERSQ